MSAHLLKERRLFTITLLGFSSGLPLALTSSTLQAWFTEAGVNLLAIGALTLIGIPYTWKFLWAPFIDKIVPPILGRRRGWIFLTQLSLSLSLIVLAQLSPNSQGSLMGILALMIAFFSASQDVAIDAYRTDILKPSERGPGLSYYIFTFRIALLVSGGLALVLADHIGWRWTYEIMGGLMGLSMLVTYFTPAETKENIPTTLWIAIVEPFKDLWQRHAIILILLFIVLYKAGDALALSLMSNFLLGYLHFSLTDIGIAYKTIGVIATLLGALLSGRLLTKMNLYHALLYFGFAQAISNLLLMALAVIGKSYSFMVLSIFVEGVCSGMSTTALLVFVTSLCHAEYSATQFAVLSALAALGRVLLGPVAALMVKSFGWALFYSSTVVFCLPSLILLYFLRRRVLFHVEAVT